MPPSNSVNKTNGQMETGCWDDNDDDREFVPNISDDPDDGGGDDHEDANIRRRNVQLCIPPKVEY